MTNKTAKKRKSSVKEVKNPLDDKVEQILEEASVSAEEELRLEDEGWFRLGESYTGYSSDLERIETVKRSRYFAMRDPLAKQAVRLWTDYTFGTGISWNSQNESAKAVLENFWYNIKNRSVLSARGQRKMSNKLLIDGEVFFAIFLSDKESIIRTIDPLEITEIISNPDDKEDVKYYKRDWFDRQGHPHTSYYRDYRNMDDERVKDKYGTERGKTEEAVIYHLALNDLDIRGTPMLLPALDWIKWYRRFLGARVAVMLALARFAWKSKIKGGANAMAAIKAVTNEKTPDAGSTLLENMAVDTNPVIAHSNARNAYDDGRMLRLQVCAATGWPEQYYGDISIGNLATAKTVELPVMKMCQSYQGTWSDAFSDIDEIILTHAGVAPDKQYVDRDFPPIAPEDAVSLADALSKISMAFPELASSPDVLQQALIALGVNDPAEVLDKLNQENEDSEESGITQLTNQLKLSRVLRELKEVLKDGRM